MALSWRTRAPSSIASCLLCASAGISSDEISVCVCAAASAGSVCVASSHVTSCPPNLRRVFLPALGLPALGRALGKRQPAGGGD